MKNKTDAEVVAEIRKTIESTNSLFREAQRRKMHICVAQDLVFEANQDGYFVFSVKASKEL